MPSISSAGIGSGLDVQSIVSQLMAIERQPLQRLQFKQNQLEAQISAYGKLSSTLSTFQDAMDKLGTVSALKVYKTASTNEDVITATASSDAEVGTFGVEVVRLAQQHKMASKELASTDTFGGTAGDALHIQVGADVADTITIDLSTAKTLAEIRDVINDDVNNPGVSATIINGDNGNQKLILTSKDSGADSALTLTKSGGVKLKDFDFLTVNDTGDDTSLLDAEVVVDGYSITRATNTISNIISGVTLNLLDSDPGNTYTISIQRDLESVKESVQGFADAFNELRSSFKSLRNGELEADSSLLSLERQVFSVLNNPASGGVYSMLTEVGLRMQKDGTMTLDSSDLEAALQSEFDGVAQLFAADTQGFANRLSNIADTWLGSGGLLESRTDGLESRIDTLEDRQVSFERNLDMVEARYLAQFSALDALVGQLQGTGQFLTQQLASLPGANQNR